MRLRVLSVLMMNQANKFDVSVNSAFRHQWSAQLARNDAQTGFVFVGNKNNACFVVVSLRIIEHGNKFRTQRENRLLNENV